VKESEVKVALLLLGYVLSTYEPDYMKWIMGKGTARVKCYIPESYLYTSYGYATPTSYSPETIHNLLEKLSEN